jgi:hypothetical protein
MTGTGQIDPVASFHHQRHQAVLMTTIRNDGALNVCAWWGGKDQ